MSSYFLVIFLLLNSSIVGAAGYLQTIPHFWQTLYPQGGQSLYCDIKFKPYDRRFNIEHVYPMSWVSKTLRCGNRKQCRKRSERFNRIESDMHNMYPARKDLNKRRGAMGYGIIKGESLIEPRCDMEIDERKRRVEPRPEVRGDIARSMLYMSDRYDLPIYKKQRALLLKWHRSDPPDEKERQRNKLVARKQGSVNKWISSKSIN